MYIYNYCVDRNSESALLLIWAFSSALEVMGGVRHTGLVLGRGGEGGGDSGQRGTTNPGYVPAH